MSDYIVITTPTVMDGLVVRWYRSEAAALNGHEQVSASRNGVVVNGYLHEVPEEVLIDANARHTRRCATADRDDWVRMLATHRKPFMSGRLEPVAP